MKNKNVITKNRLSAIVIGLLASSSLVLAANYNALDHQQNNFGNLDQLSPKAGEQGGLNSGLESLRQAELNNKKANYLEVIDLLKQNKIDDANKKIAELLKKNPDEPEYYNLQALLETLKKDTVAAQQSYDKAIKLDPKNMLALLGSSKLALDAGQLDKAKEFANTALAVNDKAINTYLLLADIAYKQKDNAEVEKVLLTAQSKAKGDIKTEIEVIKSLGQLYSIQKQPEKILALCEDLDKRYPDNALALNLLAQAQIVNDKKPLAEQTLQKLINQNKQDIDNRILLARLLSEHPDKEKETLALLDETALIAPDKPQALVFKAAYLIKLKRTPEALQLAEKIDKQFPKLILGKLLKGDVYLADKQLDKAIEQYQQAYKIQPNERVLFTLADLMIAQKKQPEAIKLLNDALEKDKKDLNLHFKLATIYQQQNDLKQAEAHYDAMLTEQSDNVIALNNLALLYFQKNDPRALALAKRAYEKAPESPAILDTYGYILIKQGQPKEGLPLLEKAAALAPKANDVQFHLAEAYVANDNTQKAITLLDPLVKAEQDFAEKKAAVSLLDKLKAK